MPIDPIKVPQNVYVEDRIAGPLTLRQVLFSAVGGGSSYAIYSLLTKTYGVLPLPIIVIVWLPAAIAVAFAFVRINDLTLFHIILLMLERLNKPGIRTFAPRRGIVINIRTFADQNEKRQETAIEAAKNKKTAHIKELTTLLDRSFDQEEEDPLSPLEEPIEETPAQEAPPAPPRPVDPGRVAVSEGSRPLQSAASGTGTGGSVSIFHDISPRAS